MPEVSCSIQKRSPTTCCGIIYLADRAILRSNSHADMELEHKLSGYGKNISMLDISSYEAINVLITMD